MKILALDLGVHVGWCTYPAIANGTMKFELGRGETPGMRYLRFRNWFKEMLELAEPEIVAYEAPHLRGGYTTELLTAFSAIIREEAETRGIQTIAVHTGTMKKHLTGDGRAGKLEVLDAVKRAGYCPANYHEADAFGVMKYVKDHY